MSTSFNIIIIIKSQSIPHNRMARFLSRVAEIRLAGVTPSLTARSRVISLESFIIPKSELWASNVSNAFCLGYGCCQ